MVVYIDNLNVDLDLISKSDIKSCALTALEQEGRTADEDLSIIIGDDDHIQQLNREFMGIAEPTDVLAFPAGHIDPDSGHLYLGDVIISLPRAINQAKHAGHSPSAEVSLLVIHGVLHLLGYDHDQPEVKAEMWSSQDSILKILGIEIKSPQPTNQLHG